MSKQNRPAAPGLDERFDAVLGEQKAGSARPPWCVIELHLSTPVRDSTEGTDYAEQLIRWLEEMAEQSTSRIAAVKKLTDAGWSLDRPAVRFSDPELVLAALQSEVDRVAAGRRVTEPLHCDGYLDFDLRFRKRLPTEQHFRAEVESLDLNGRDSWNLGWDEQPETGDVAWWDSL